MKNNEEGGLRLCPTVDKMQTGPIFIPQGQQKLIYVQGKNFPTVVCVTVMSEIIYMFYIDVLYFQKSGHKVHWQ
jgi:hypothetical protein